MYGDELLCFWCTISRISDRMYELKPVFLINDDGYPKVPPISADRAVKGKQ